MHIQSKFERFLWRQVRIGTIPMRLLSLKMGADLVYSEEMVDKRIIGSQRQVNRTIWWIHYVLFIHAYVVQV
jgi:hypothetical protein